MEKRISDAFEAMVMTEEALIDIERTMAVLQSLEEDLEEHFKVYGRVEHQYMLANTSWDLLDRAKGQIEAVRDRLHEKSKAGKVHNLAVSS